MSVQLALEPDPISTVDVRGGQHLVAVIKRQPLRCANRELALHWLRVVRELVLGARQLHLHEVRIGPGRGRDYSGALCWTPVLSGIERLVAHAEGLDTLLMSARARGAKR